MSDKEGVPRTSDAAALYRLMAWLSPAYPVGAFSYSSGIEWAVEAGDVTRRHDAAALAHGDDRPTAAVSATRPSSPTPIAPAAGDDDQALKDVAELAAAFAPSKERFLETTAQGRAFIDATQAAWPCAALEPADGDLGRPARLSGRRRRRRRRPRHPAGGRPHRVPARGRRQSRLRGRAARSRSARPTASACSPRSSR